MGRWLILVVLALGSACTKRNPAACCTTDADCEAKGLPAGSECEAGYTCIRNTCIAPTSCEASSDCEDEDLPLCNVDTKTCVTCLVDTDCAGGFCDPGDNLCRACAADTDCASGYCDLVTGNCGQNILAWRYLPDACDAPAETALTTPAPALTTINTTNASECTRVVAQANGPEICVLHYTSISVPTTSTVRIKGARVVALVADQNIDIAGTLEVGATFEPGPRIVEAGPGGTFATSGTYPQVSIQTPDVATAGGGGAGFKSAGADGGHLAPTGQPMTDLMNGGPTVNITSVPILVGGPAAESRLNGDGTAQVTGGPGGGGMTVISCGGKITVTGSINASGGGGSAGTEVRSTNPLAVYKGGGFGGGAGGNVLFQALNIELTGKFLASGGGGGPGAPDCSMYPTLCNGGGVAFGVTPDLYNFNCAPAQGGQGDAGGGGAGGCDGTPPTSGGARANQSTPATSGGGGGSVGFFRTATLFNAPVVTPALAKPAFEPNEQIPRR